MPAAGTNQTAGHAVEDTGPADFERAIEVAGFGLFNVLLLLTAVPCIASTLFETTTMSYVLPVAECDLSLDLLHKGLLNAMTYIGMILCAVPWGYLADTWGRRKVLISSLLTQGIIVLCSATSQTVTQLLVYKFLSGCVACGPLGTMMTYLSELHGKKFRSSVVLLVGVMKSVGILLLPVLAFVLLPQAIDVQFLLFKLHAWHIFIAITCLPSLLAGCLICFLPESPKFLMTHGRNTEALKAFQTIYWINTWQRKEAYPIKTLIEEGPEKSRTNSGHGLLWRAMKRLQPMFSRLYLVLSVMVYFMNFSILLGQNSIRLWLPQVFSTMQEFEAKGVKDTSMCAILEHNVNKTQLIQNETASTQCEVNITPESFRNNIIVAIVSICGFALAAILVHIIGNNILLICSLVIAFVSGISLYFASSSLAVLALSALFTTISNISTTTVLSASVNLFPTTMRSMVVTLIIAFGRFGSLLGNLLFPLLMTIGCLPPFLLISGVMLGAGIIALFLPNSNKLSLK